MAFDSETGATATPEPTIDLGLRSRDVVPVIIMVTAVVAALTRQQPTGTLFADLALTAAFGAGVVWVSRYASGQAVMLTAGLALFSTGLRLPSAIIAAGAIAVAFAVTNWRKFDKDSWQIGVAMSTAMTVLAVMDLPNIRFERTASLLAVITVAPTVITGLKAMPDKYRPLLKRGAAAVGTFAIVATALAGFTALSVRSSLEDGISLAEAGVTAVEGGDSAGAIELLEDAEAKLSAASSRLTGPLTWPARLVPITAQNARAVATASEQGVALAQTAGRTVSRADVERIRGANGAIDIDLINDVNLELTSANATLAQAQLSLFEVQSPWLAPPLDDRLVSVQAELSEAAADINLAAQGTAVLPNILGADGLRRYLVLFVQPAESREFGGFVGAYGFLEADNGNIDLTESGSIDVDLGRNRAFFTNPGLYPEFFVRLSPNRDPQNLTGIGDLSTIATAAADLVPQWRGDPDFTIDGVLTIDPYALAGLLELTGPIQLDGRDVAIDSSNVADFLIREQYEEFEISERDVRQDLLKVLAAEAFDRLLTIEAPGPERLGAIFGPLARADRIAFATYDDQENAFFDRIFMSADLPRVEPTTDMLGVFTATGTASKLDAFASRSTTYVVSIDPATGVYTAQAEVAITNDVPADASLYVTGRPADGLDGLPIDQGTNLIAVSIYGHDEVTNLTSTAPFDVKVSSPALGYERTWVVTELPPRETTTISFTTQGVASPQSYGLVLPPSRSANPSAFTLIIQPTEGWRVVADDTAADGSWTRTVFTDLGTGFVLGFEPTS